MNKHTEKLNRMTQTALLIAVELVMKAIGLGSVPVGPLYMSFLTLPIAVGAMLLGPEAGALLGLVFGALSFKDALSGASLMTSNLLLASPVHTFILCVITRTLMGFCCGLIFKAADAADKKNTWCWFVGAVSAPLLNTLFFMGYLVLVFYNCEYVQNLVSRLGASNPLMFVILLVGVQGLVEAAVCGIAGGLVSRSLAGYLRKANRPKV
ncbi:MAG: ECF transporter S component [Firmicutes bacterium]|nr:ECF transporter S component [Bacillota bacterium]